MTAATRRRRLWPERAPCWAVTTADTAAAASTPMISSMAIPQLQDTSSSTLRPCAVGTSHVYALPYGGARVLAFRRTRVVSIELSEPAAPISAEGYDAVLALARVGGTPVGCVTVPAQDGECHGEQLRQHAIDTLAAPITRERAVGSLRAATVPLPSVTVAVCTRDRAADLSRCLEALDALAPAADEIIVVDNGSRDPAVRAVVAVHPRARYVLEPEAGLDRARNRAIAEASSDIVAFTDDDVVVDVAWVGALRRALADDRRFRQSPAWSCRSSSRRPHRCCSSATAGSGEGSGARFMASIGGRRAGGAVHGGAGKFGTGANMAFRRSVFAHDRRVRSRARCRNGDQWRRRSRHVLPRIRQGTCFDTSLRRSCAHRHRRTYTELRRQIANNGVGFYSYLVRNALAFPAERGDLVWLGGWWLWYWNIRRLLDIRVETGEIPARSRVGRVARVVCRHDEVFPRAAQCGCRTRRTAGAANS